MNWKLRNIVRERVAKSESPVAREIVRKIDAVGATRPAELTVEEGVFLLREVQQLLRETHRDEFPPDLEMLRSDLRDACDRAQAPPQS